MGATRQKRKDHRNMNQMKNLFDDTFLRADGVAIFELVLGKVDVWGWAPA
jgi:hypothetical protein